MIEIPLTRGFVATVDDDCEWLLQWKWHASCRAHGRSAPTYAQRTGPRSEGKKLIYMHRAILKAQRGEFVDHIDGNGLNNTRANLHIVPQWVNQAKAHRLAGKHKYRGIAPNKRKWAAHFRKKHLGSYPTPEEAAAAYDHAAYAALGSLAVLNFPHHHIVFGGGG
jgi:hypothetical protein